jgi:ABC-type oligopeptide transport system substrate-binding subunit
VASFDNDGVVLRRSESYWNHKAVKLETVRFVPAASSDAALDAYRNGAVDAVTNADFSPLALKLLEPYDDFRRTTFAALNIYEFNIERPPFRDRRVREAMAIAIDRERLTDGELEGATQPAYAFLPFSQAPKGKLVQDNERARELLETAGYPDGVGFPLVRLTVNRNDTQIRIARSVAEMWRRNLNIKTEVVVRESAEMEAARSARDFDLIRRGVVLPTNAEAANLRSIVGDAYQPQMSGADKNVERPSPGSEAKGTPPGNTAQTPSTVPTPGEPPITASIGSEEDALFQLTAIPLYFPTSYSLVRPFVIGFEANSLDATLLHEVFIDTEWAMPSEQAEE